MRTQARHPSNKSKQRSSRRANGAHDLLTDAIGEAADVIIEELKRMRPALTWLSGKTLHLSLLRETAAHIDVKGTTLRIRLGGRISADADLMVATTRRTLFDLLDGSETPTSALFQGRLRVAGRSEDLVRIHDLFLRAAERLVASKRLQRLLAAVKELKAPKAPLELEVHDFLGSKQPRISVGAAGHGAAPSRRPRASKQPSTD